MGSVLRGAIFLAIISDEPNALLCAALPISNLARDGGENSLPVAMKRRGLLQALPTLPPHFRDALHTRSLNVLPLATVPQFILSIGTSHFFSAISNPKLWANPALSAK
jgi:hypothetical protein